MWQLTCFIGVLIMFIVFWLRNWLGGWIHYLNRPVVYLCNHQGVYGVVTRTAYRRAHKIFWQSVRRGVIGYPGFKEKYILHIPETWLFSDMDGIALSGKLKELELLLEGCRIEHAVFEVRGRNSMCMRWIGLGYVHSNPIGFMEIYKLVHGCGYRGPENSFYQVRDWTEAYCNKH